MPNPRDTPTELDDIDQNWWVLDQYGDYGPYTREWAQALASEIDQHAGVTADGEGSTHATVVHGSHLPGRRLALVRLTVELAYDQDATTPAELAGDVAELLKAMGARVVGLDEIVAVAVQ